MGVKDKSNTSGGTDTGNKSVAGDTEVENADVESGLGGNVDTGTGDDEGNSLGGGADGKDKNKSGASDDKKNAGEKDKKNEPADVELKLPEGFDPKDPLLASFKAAAKAEGVSSKQAQKLFDTYLNDIKSAVESDKVRRQQQDATWAKELQADPDFGGDKLKATLESANAAVTRFGGPALHKHLRATGQGNDPVVIRAWARVAQAISEAKTKGTLGEKPKTDDRREVLRRRYPSMDPDKS